MRKLFLAALASAACSFGAAQAATPVQVTFSGSDRLGYNAFGPPTYFDQQTALLDALGANPTFSFTFEYDPDAVKVGGAFPVTLLSGQAGSITDFSDYTASILGGGGNILNFRLYRLDYQQSSLTYTSQITFTLVDNQGGLTGGGGSLPDTIDPASLEQRNAEFRITRSG
ncbi:MAG: hypothetical protein KIS90_15910, partial [Phenylobacterium sp.]|nr:hypothetical protein [Phenylobacterium sp.]